MAQYQTQIKKATSNRPLLKVIVILFLIIISFWIASFFPDLVLTLIISALTAFVLKPVVTAIEFQFNIHRKLAVAIVFLAVGVIVALISIFLIPIAIDRLKILYDELKNFPFEAKLNEAVVSFTTNYPIIDAKVANQKVHEFVAGGLEALNNMISATIGFLSYLLIIPFITYFILAEGDLAIKKLIERVPNKYFEMTLNVINKIENELVGYLRGWILDSAIVGILNIIGFYIIGVNYAFLLGIIAGVSNLIPYIGPFFGVIPAILVSLIQYGDFSQVYLILISSLVVIQFIDNVIIQPLCFSKTVDMHPVTVILVLIIGNSLMGIAGMLLAIPIATILKSSAVETYWGLKNYQITA